MYSDTPSPPLSLSTITPTQSWTQDSTIDVDDVQHQIQTQSEAPGSSTVFEKKWIVTEVGDNGTSLPSFASPTACSTVLRLRVHRKVVSLASQRVLVLVAFPFLPISPTDDAISSPLFSGWSREERNLFRFQYRFQFGFGDNGRCVSYALLWHSNCEHSQRLPIILFALAHPASPSVVLPCASPSSV